jgi:hypothetical protein
MAYRQGGTRAGAIALVSTYIFSVQTGAERSPGLVHVHDADPTGTSPRRLRPRSRLDIAERGQILWYTRGWAGARPLARGGNHAAQQHNSDGGGLCCVIPYPLPEKFGRQRVNGQACFSSNSSRTGRLGRTRAIICQDGRRRCERALAGLIGPRVYEARPGFTAMRTTTGLGLSAILGIRPVPRSAGRAGGLTTT